MLEIYNSSWFGSVLYNLYNKEAVKLESSFNRSVKVMLDLPFGTHRGLIEPLVGRKHQRISFIKRFFIMTQKMRVSKKPVLRRLLQEIELDVLSTTGSNLRNIMIETSKSCIQEVEISHLNELIYFNLGQEEEWRIEFLRYLLEERRERPLNLEEGEWLKFLCID